MLYLENDLTTILFKEQSLKMKIHAVVGILFLLLLVVEAVGGSVVMYFLKLRKRGSETTTIQKAVHFVRRRSWLVPFSNVDFTLLVRGLPHLLPWQRNGAWRHLHRR